MTIFELKLHESLHEDNGNIDITRVPGGWLYYYVFRQSTTFVPFNRDLDPVSLVEDKCKRQFELATNEYLLDALK